MACQGCGSILINYSGDPKVIGKRRHTARHHGHSVRYYDKSLFSQPSGLDVAGFGNTKRNFFRRPAQWNVDFSLFKAFPIGRFRPEFRLDVANLFNPGTGARRTPRSRRRSS